MLTDPVSPAAATEDLLFAEVLIAAAHEAAAARPRPPAPPNSPVPEKIMLPAALDSSADVILRIREQFAGRIVEGKKNYEYRAYRLNSDVRYVWLWEDERAAIRYIIAVGGPKRPGEVNDPSGDGNVDFDEGRKTASYGYPIHAVYRLPYELTREILLNKYSIDMADGRQYVKQDLVDVFPVQSLERLIPVLEDEDADADAD